MPYSWLFDAEEKILVFLATIVPLQLIIMIIIILFSFWKKELKEEEWFKNLIPLLAYSIGSFSVVFPIAEKSHFSIAATCTVISFIYLVYALGKDLFSERKI